MSRSNKKGWSSLSVCVLVILIVWALVLPLIGSQKSIRAQIENMNRQGVDPSALYYTDLEAMERIQSNMTAISQTHGDVFWSISSHVAE